MPSTRSQAHASSSPPISAPPAAETPSHHRNGHATPSAPTTDLTPPTTAASSAIFVSPRYRYNGPCALTSVATQGAFLGGLFFASAVFTVQLLLQRDQLWRLPFFTCVCSVFHFMEFYATARWNPGMADRNSFLLFGNGVAQFLAYLAALLEVGVREWVGWGRGGVSGIGDGWLVGLGLVLVVVGQGARSMAMREAGTNFNHLVQFRKRDNHVLVTSGIYRIMRHPSYFGFFYWALGTQMILGNPFSFMAYALVLWKFFSQRVRHEERYLVVFFDDYEKYRERTRTLIPFVG